MARISERSSFVKASGGLPRHAIIRYPVYRPAGFASTPPGNAPCASGLYERAWRPAGGGGAVSRAGRTAQRLDDRGGFRSEEHTSELQSLMRISYAVFCLKKKNKNNT